MTRRTFIFRNGTAGLLALCSPEACATKQWFTAAFPIAGASPLMRNCDQDNCVFLCRINETERETV
jgi:hypothetical protein